VKEWTAFIDVEDIDGNLSSMSPTAR